MLFIIYHSYTTQIHIFIFIDTSPFIISYNQYIYVSTPRPHWHATSDSKLSLIINIYSLSYMYSIYSLISTIITHTHHHSLQSISKLTFHFIIINQLFTIIIDSYLITHTFYSFNFITILVYINISSYW